MLDTKTEDILEQIEKIENWLRNNPNADWEIRFDKINELRELNEQLDNN